MGMHNLFRDLIWTVLLVFFFGFFFLFNCSETRREEKLDSMAELVEAQYADLYGTFKSCYKVRLSSQHRTLYLRRVYSVFFFTAFSRDLPLIALKPPASVAPAQLQTLIAETYDTVSRGTADPHIRYTFIRSFFLFLGLPSHIILY